MKESFLHLFWQKAKLDSLNLVSTQGDVIQIERRGFLNTLQGPDFTNVIVTINGQKWAGNVEIHVKSSDWYAHQHHLDELYQNIILHVVYEHDVEVFDSHQNAITTLELQSLIPSEWIQNYEQLFQSPYNFIPCENFLKTVETLRLQNWLERLYFERLEKKSLQIIEGFNQLENYWEAVLFYVLLKNFGGNLNGEILTANVKRVDFKVIQKCLVNHQLMPLLFGLNGLLENDITDGYYKDLQKEYKYLKSKYKIEDSNTIKLHFFGCRPANFPTIKLMQFIKLYEKHQHMLSKIILLDLNFININNDFWKLDISLYWQNHYTFGKESSTSSKQLSQNSIALIYINTILPFLFVYQQSHSNTEIDIAILASAFKAEKNHIIQEFEKYGLKVMNALESQALLTLKQDYCNQQKCSECMIGAQYLLN